MGGEEGRGHRSWPAVAVLLVLCSLARTLTCFSLRRPSRNVKQDKVVDEAAVMGLRRGSILFYGKALDSLFQSASAATATIDGVLNMDLTKSDGKRMEEQMSQLEDGEAKEAEWRRLKPYLHCGKSKMKLKATGLRAADITLDMGDAHPLPLIQVPETCRYSMKQKALSLILVVSYNGCNVIQENGNYVVSLRWQEIPIKVTCPILKNSARPPALTSAKPLQQPWTLPLPHGSWRLNRRKRQTHHPVSYDPRTLYYYNCLYYYYLYMMSQGQTPVTNTTTAKPDMTTNPSTEKPPQMNPPYFPPNYLNYLYYLYYSHYPYYQYYVPHFPVKTTPSPTTGQTTAEMMACDTASTTKLPQNPQYPPYIHPQFPYYPVFPGHPNYQVIQHVYAKHPHHQTAEPSDATTAKPCDSSLANRRSGLASTTTPVFNTQTVGRCQNVPKPSNAPCRGPGSAVFSFSDLPFSPYVSYKAGKLHGIQKHVPQTTYKSGFQPRAYPPRHPGFDYWQPVPWFAHSPGKDGLQLE